MDKLGNITLYNADCMEIMKGFADKQFSICIVDPPYGINRDCQKSTFCKNSKHNRKFFEKKNWDKCIPDEDYFNELFRVSKNQIIWGANYFTKYLPPSMGWIFWDKGQDLSMSDGELAFTSFNRALRRKVINRSELAREGTIHPTQKPIQLYKWILKNYAHEGETILDTHLGSGSSAIAAHDYGYEFTGIELDSEYYEAAKKRISEHQRQLSMF
jgi:site-specific DNA-methyltransferase (adenine-specific)